MKYESNRDRIQKALRAQRQGRRQRIDRRHKIAISRCGRSWRFWVTGWQRARFSDVLEKIDHPPRC